MTLPAVALLHGFTGSSESFREIAPVLARRGVTVETPALLGHGSADVGGVASFEAEVDRLARHLRERAAAYHLVGYSLGGRLGIGLLVLHPELFRSATLISTQPGLRLANEREERRRSDERWVELLEKEGLGAFIDAWEKLPLFATQDGVRPEALAAQRSERRARDPRGLAQSLRTCGLAEMPPYWDRLAKIEVPTTLMVGEDDAKFAGIAREMHAARPLSRVSVVAGAGHNVVLERPGAVLEAVIAAVEAA